LRAGGEDQFNLRVKTREKWIRAEDVIIRSDRENARKLPLKPPPAFDQALQAWRKPTRKIWIRAVIV